MLQEKLDILYVGREAIRIGLRLVRESAAEMVGDQYPVFVAQE